MQNTTEMLSKRIMDPELFTQAICINSLLISEAAIKEPLQSQSIEGMLVYPVGEQCVDLSYTIDGYPKDLHRTWAAVASD